MGGAERLWSVRDTGERAHGYGFGAGMRVAAELGYGLNAFRGRSTMTPSSGLASARAVKLRLGVGWTLGEATRSESVPTDHGVRLSATARW